jgi:allantoinase
MIVRGRRVVVRDRMVPAAITIDGGRISSVAEHADPQPGERVVDAGDLVVMPGLVDSHVHVNEPGRTEWEGFATATRAAAAGGVTTIVDMPLNSVPPTTTLAGLQAKREAAAGQVHVDVAFWGGVVPGNVGDLEPLAAGGVRGFKCFLSPSGVDEFGHVSEADLRAAMPVVARCGVPLLVHAEWPSALRDATGDPRQYSTWLDSRPPEAEAAAIAVVLRLAAECDARVHIVHLATSTALPALQDARRHGTRVTVETCPHYLTFAAEEIAAGDTALKCAPPIRGAEEREALWTALRNGAIDLVATDHSPAPPAVKHLQDGDFVRAWGGIASVQIGLPAVWTGARARGATIPDLVRWMAEAPARLGGLHPRKGVIAPGADADLVIWDPDEEWVVDRTTLFHRHPVTPYHGLRMRGRVQTTILGGEIVYEHPSGAGHPRGRLL